MDGAIRIRHRDRAGRVLLAGEGSAACMEVFGDIERLLATRGR